MKYGETYRGAVAAQRVALERITDPDTDSKAIAQLMASYVKMEMLKLRLRMKPAPKPIDVSKPKRSEAPSVNLE